MIGPVFAEGGILGCAYRGGQPHSAVTAEHRVVVVHPGFPKPPISPVGPRLQPIEHRGMTRTEAEWHLGIAHRRLERGGDVLHWVENRDEVGALFGRAVQSSA